jgi:DNA-binding MarR family transcriptional regulator
MSPRRQGLIDAVGVAVQAYQRSTDAFDDVVANRLGLNRIDLRCLDWLFDGPRTIGQLAEATALSSPATTALIDRLERKGFVRRVRDTADRRKILVELTDAAQQQAQQLYGVLAADGARLLANYTPEQLAFLRDYLEAARTLTDQHRHRIAEAASGQPSHRRAAKRRSGAA